MPLNIKLIDEQKSSLNEILNHLLAQKFGTDWAEKTNQFPIDSARSLGEIYGDAWYKGFLPEEFFLNILLPKHGHSMEKEEIFLPADTLLKDVMIYFEKADPRQTEECLKNINYLKQEIKEKGFISNIVLAVINGTVKHVDGLHRMVALSLLLKEGYAYKPIPVFLCDGERYIIV